MSRLLLWVSLGALLLAAPLPAAPPIPGGILDATGRTAYLATAGGIDAVDLTRGEVRWRNRSAHVPLFLAGDRLYALVLSSGNTLHVCGLDLASRGERVFLSDAVEFPRWVVTGEAAGHTFSTSWRLDRGQLRLDWLASASAGGTARKEAAGQVRIDLERGRVDGTVLDRPPARPVRQVPPQFEKLAVRWHGRFAGQLLALIAEDLPPSRPGARQQRLVLRSWDERGRPSEPRELMRGSQLTVLPALDGAHVWLRDAAPHAPDAIAPPPAHWAVYSLIGGHLVARVPFVPGTREATLIGRRAYCLAAAPVRTTFDRPTRRAYLLHAIDLETARVVWKHPLGSKDLLPLGDAR